MRRLRPLALDFVATRRRTNWIGVIALVASIGIATAMVQRLSEISAERAALQARLELQAGARATPANATRPAGDEAKGVERVTRQLSLPWPQMIESIESAASRQVALLQIQPEPERGTLRLTAEAGTPQAMLDYVRRLGESQALAGAHLVSHQVRREGGARPIQFVAQATLREHP